MPQRAADPHRSAGRCDLSSHMLRDIVPRNIRWVSNDALKSLTQTIVDLSNVFQSHAAGVAGRTLHTGASTFERRRRVRAPRGSTGPGGSGPSGPRAGSSRAHSGWRRRRRRGARRWLASDWWERFLQQRERSAACSHVLYFLSYVSQLTASHTHRHHTHISMCTHLTGAQGIRRDVLSGRALGLINGRFHTSE
eukprot:6128928-Prymnesium_polylepis.3